MKLAPSLSVGSLSLALACSAGAGLPLCHPDEIDLPLAGLSVLPYGGEYLMVFPGQGTITSGAITLNFTTAGSFQAQNLVFELGGPTGGILILAGQDLGWSGQGTFSSTVHTSNFNGSLQAEGQWSFWFMNISQLGESLPQAVEGTWNAGTEIRFGFDPRPYWCAADWNASGEATVQDIYDFLACWNSGRADFNGVNGTTVQDIYDFLATWNAGCPCGPGEC